MAVAWYWWHVTWRRTWQSTLVIAILCGILGAVSLAALAGARRTESAYGRYLSSINASDVMINIPSPDTELNAEVARQPGIRASASWAGLDVEPVVHGHIDDSFTTDALQGSMNGDFFTQDTMTVIKGRLPRLGSTDEIALTPNIARLFGVGVGGHVTYALFDPKNQSDDPPVIGHATFRVTSIVDFPPVLVDQFDQPAAAVIPPAATAHLHKEIAFSWVGARLDRGSAGIPALQTSLAKLADQVGDGYSFAVRKLDDVHRQVQDAIRPQAVALAVLGALSALALLVLVGQALAQMLDRSAGQLTTLRALGETRPESAVAGALSGLTAVVGGVALAVVGAVALSPLAPVEPVRQFDPVRGFRFDLLVLLGGGALLALVLLGMLALLAWRTVRKATESGAQNPSAIAQAAVTVGLPEVMALGAGYALEPPPGGRRATVRANLVGSVVAVIAVVTAVVFGASLNGLVTHPARYGWNWDVLLQSEGGYGAFFSTSPTPNDFHSGAGGLYASMAGQPGVAGWSTFAFAQLPMDGQVVPVLGLATHKGSVAPPTVSGHPLDGTGPFPLSGTGSAGPDEIELGVTTLHQLGKKVGDTVHVGVGRTARTLSIVGVVTLPSIGVQLSDHVSLGTGAMLPESTLLSILNFDSVINDPTANVNEALTALPSTVAFNLDPRGKPGPVVKRILATDPGGDPGGTYRQPRVLGAAIVNAGQMGGQPIALAVALGFAVLVSLSVAVVAGARRRRRELAVLQALGFRRRQLRSIIAWQTATLLTIAVAFGLPLGIIGGHWAWTGFAASLGVVPVTVVPILPLLGGLVGLVVVGALVTAVPAVVATTASPATVLRIE